jgi:hypothetical protein
MPNLQIHAEQSASAQAVAVVAVSGTASAQRLVLFTMVKMCVTPCEGGSGPIPGPRGCVKNSVLGWECELAEVGCECEFCLFDKALNS